MRISCLTTLRATEAETAGPRRKHACDHARGIVQKLENLIGVTKRVAVAQLSNLRLAFRDLIIVIRDLGMHPIDYIRLAHLAGQIIRVK